MSKFEVTMAIPACARGNYDNYKAVHEVVMTTAKSR